jgi:hypothetical protein
MPREVDLRANHGQAEDVLGGSAELRGGGVQRVERGLVCWRKPHSDLPLRGVVSLHQVKVRGRGEGVGELLDEVVHAGSGRAIVW